MIKKYYIKRLLSSFFIDKSAYKWGNFPFCSLSILALALSFSAHAHRLLDDQGEVWQVEVVNTPASMARGLMFRLYLPRNSAMLFVFDPPRETAFWMRQTYIPLTMRFYDAYGRLLTFYPYATPCHQMPCPVYPSHARVKYVLETRTADRDIRPPYAFPAPHRRLLHLLPLIE